MIPLTKYLLSLLLLTVGSGGAACGIGLAFSLALITLPTLLALSGVLASVSLTMAFFTTWQYFFNTRSGGSNYSIKQLIYYESDDAQKIVFGHMPSNGNKLTSHQFDGLEKDKNPYHYVEVFGYKSNSSIKREDPRDEMLTQRAWNRNGC